MSNPFTSIQEDATPQVNAQVVPGNVTATTTSTILVAANPFRTEANIANNSTAILYVMYGLPASSSQFTAQLNPGDVLNTDFQGDIYGAWASATGNAQCTEVQVKK